MNRPENVQAFLSIAQAKNEIAESWFAAAGKSLAEVKKQINDSGDPDSFAFPNDLQISLKVNIESTRATVNVCSRMLPGKTDEYIIIGAHYDSFGLWKCGPRSRLYPNRSDSSGCGRQCVLHRWSDGTGAASRAQEGPTPARNSIRFVRGGGAWVAGLS